MKKSHFALRTRILLFTGSVIIFIMLATSAAILFGAKHLLVNNAIENAENVTKALEIPVLNEFLKKETNKFSLEEELGALINGYEAKVKNLIYIKIVDPQGKIIAHTDWRKVNTFENDSLGLIHTGKIISSIYNSPNYGEILETIAPVEIAGKRWGIMKIAFDAEDLIARLQELYFILIISTLLVIVSALVILYFISGKLTRTLSELVELIDTLDYNFETTKSAAKRTDETEFLYSKFEEMRQRLQRSRNELINAQKQIYHAEKLASIGRLASGVAHEINNPLNGIKSCLYSIEKNPGKINQNKEYLDLIDEGITNIELIVKKLLGFARQKGSNNELVDINESINKVISLLEYRLQQKNINIIRQFGQNAFTKADGQLLQEVFMNIILNALDASPEKGELIIITRSDEKELEIKIADNGEGISVEESDKIFDPFYTTKEQGKGTGLGLSVSLGIIENLGGTIKVESEKGKGATFIITLPKKN